MVTLKADKNEPNITDQNHPGLAEPGVLVGRLLGRIYGLRRFRSRAPMTSPMMIEPNTRTMIVRYSIDIS
jgi:hypothetical protein